MRMNALRRFTNLPALIDLLSNRRLTLLSPSLWEDRNDAFYLERFKDICGHKTVLALCFTSKPETSHHWKVFSGDTSGVCIQFNRAKLLQTLKRQKSDIRFGEVRYRLVKELKANLPVKEELPFLKRKHYEDESEFRIIYVDGIRDVQTKHISIDLGIIERITLSPWMPRPLSDATKSLLRTIDGCGDIEIIRTGLLEYDRWKRITYKVSR